MAILGRSREGRGGALAEGNKRGEGAWLGVTGDEYRNVKSKEESVEATLAEAYRASDQAKNLERTPVSADQGQIDKFRTSQQVVARRNLANAAQDGLVASSFLDSERRKMLQQRALAELGMSASAVAQRQQDVNAVAGQLGVVKEGSAAIPKEMARETSTLQDVADYLGGTKQSNYTVYKQARSEIDDNIRHAQGTISRLNAARPTEQQLMASWEKEIVSDYAAASQGMAEDMRRRGMSDAYIQGELQRHQSDQQAALDQMRSVAKALTGPDPAAAQAALAALYNPDVVADPKQAAPGLPGFVVGAAGAITGGYLGGPAGAKAGWDVGKGVGDIYSDERYG